MPGPFFRRRDALRGVPNLLVREEIVVMVKRDPPGRPRKPSVSQEARAVADEDGAAEDCSPRVGVAVPCDTGRGSAHPYSLIVTEDRFWESSRAWILSRSGRPSGNCRRSRDCCEGAAVTFESPVGRERMSRMARLRSRSDARKSTRTAELPGCACKLRAATNRTAP